MSDWERHITLTADQRERLTGVATLGTQDLDSFMRDALGDDFIALAPSRKTRKRAFKKLRQHLVDHRNRVERDMLKAGDEMHEAEEKLRGLRIRQAELRHDGQVRRQMP